jgi:two-component system, OmpR family, response regulator
MIMRTTDGAPTGMRILVVEDDATIAEFVARGLREAGFVVDSAADGAQGLDLALTHPYDAAVVDLMLPARDGLSLIGALRQRGSKMPVLILSARREVADRVKGLETGGDDYLTKPFAFSELLARVQALIRRSTGVAEPTRLAYADLSIDLLTREVRRAESKLDLRPREFRLLEYLLRNPGRVVSKTAILSHVFDYGFDPRTNVVDVLMHRLREKIDKDFEPKLIQTVRGAGYALRLP